MIIMLTGASGFIGRNLSAALEAAGHWVRPVSRRTGVDFARMTQPADWLPHLDGIDAVINSVGIIGETTGQTFETLHTTAPIALFHACQQAKVRRVLQVSALGADQTAFSAYHLSKRAADEALRSLDLDWFVLRPSLIYGRGSKSAELFMRLARLPLIPVVGDGQQLIQPVFIGDVVATALHCVVSPTTRQTLDILGPETVSYAGWMQRMRAAQGLSPARLLQIPPALMIGLAYLGRYFNPILQPDNLRMLVRGYRADYAPLARFLGRPPVAAEPSLFFADVASAGEAR